MQDMVLEDGSDPNEVRHWQQQQAAEAELAAAEEAVTAGAKVPAAHYRGLAAESVVLRLSLCWNYGSKINFIFRATDVPLERKCMTVHSLGMCCTVCNRTSL